MTTKGIMTVDAVKEHSYPGEWPSGKATDFESPDAKSKLNMLSTQRIATGIDWAFAPDWLTVEQACFLSGWDRGSMLSIIAEGGVDMNNDGLIQKKSLWEFQEALVEVLHWDD
jgi:hypothetical protein